MLSVGRRRKAVVWGSVLLGLYDDEGQLHHVGFSSGIKADERPALTKKLEAIATDQSFTGNTPGGPSRWSTERSAQWQPTKPKFVIEVTYDHFTGGRFRHGTAIQRWRLDKKPSQCTDGAAQAKVDIADQAAVGSSQEREVIVGVRKHISGTHRAPHC